MKSKNTIFWFLLAAALAAAIWVSNHYYQPVPAGQPPLLPGFRPDLVGSLEITPSGAREISLARTNKTWLLQSPVRYPAQTAAVDGLLAALQKLTPTLALSAGEMSRHKNAEAEYGFDNPRFRLDLSADGHAWHLLVGGKTAPGDGVYVRVVGVPGAFVTGVDWVNQLPRDAATWRDNALLDLPAVVDWLVITNGAQAIELRRDVTNHLWRMVRPLQARADNILILSALAQLRTAKATRFVTDDPKTDLAAYGLEPAALDVWLGSGTNLLAAVHAGKEDPKSAGEIYSRHEGWNAIVTTPTNALAAWRRPVSDFRDPNLLELTTPAAEIEVRNANQTFNNFTLQWHGTNWTMAGAKFAVDQDQVRSLIHGVASLRIADFVKEVVTTPQLQSWGLANPSWQVTLRSVPGDTNSVIAQIFFGAVNTNTPGEIYVKRADEDGVYAVNQSDLGLLGMPGDFFRVHPVWNFSVTNVASVTLRQNGGVRQMVRHGTNDWALAPDSQGIIANTPELEETIYRLGQLEVFQWFGRSATDDQLGITTNSLSVTLELKSGEKYSLVVGDTLYPLPSLRTRAPLAVVTLEGERWAFIVPPLLAQLMSEVLTVPPHTP